MAQLWSVKSGRCTVAFRVHDHVDLVGQPLGRFEAHVVDPLPAIHSSSYPSISNRVVGAQAAARPIGRAPCGGTLKLSLVA